MITILIIDNNTLFREGLVNLLQHEPGIIVCGEAGEIYEALDMLENLTIDIIFADADLPDMDHLRGIRLLNDTSPQSKIVLMSSEQSPELLLQAFRLGARGYLAKNHSLSQLISSIRALERGEVLIPRAMVGYLLEELSRLWPRTGQPGDLNLLTTRELEVLAELGQGYSNRKIADRLDIAENTVKVHVHNLLEKLGLRNRRQAAFLARSKNLTAYKKSR